MRHTLARMRHERVTRRLQRDEDDHEDVVDEVHHHWVVFTVPALEVALVPLLLWMFLTSSPDAGPVFAALMVGLVGHAGWHAFERFMDVFVITDRRVFRVSGVLGTKYATTPLKRILDITVEQPLPGLLLGFGHFTFESAAQEQGLREIRFVARPLERDKTIQRHLRRSGLRGRVGGGDED